MRMCRTLIGALIAVSLLLLPLGISPDLSAAHADTSAQSAMAAMPGCDHQLMKTVADTYDSAHCGSTSCCMFTCLSLMAVGHPSFVVDYGVGTRMTNVHPTQIPPTRTLPAPFRPPRA
jgi:hypothetical protein